MCLVRYDNKLTLSNFNRNVTIDSIFNSKKKNYKVLVYDLKTGFTRANIIKIEKLLDYSLYGIKGMATQTLSAHTKQKILDKDLKFKQTDKTTTFLYLQRSKIINPFKINVGMQDNAIAYRIFTDRPDCAIIVNGFFLKQESLKEI